MIFSINTSFKEGDLVYVKTDPEQVRRMITGFVVRQKGEVIMYEVTIALGSRESIYCYDYELSFEIDEDLKKDGDE